MMGEGGEPLGHPRRKLLHCPNGLTGHGPLLDGSGGGGATIQPRPSY